MGEPIAVFIADDHGIVRSGLRLLIGHEPGMQVCGEAGSVEELLAGLDSSVDVLTLDLGMTQQGSAELIRRLMARLPNLGIVILTMHDDAAYARMALAAGARGYVVKTAADVELIKAIRAVAAGEQFCTVAVTEADGVINSSSFVSPLDSLSGREREVLVYVAQGYTSQQIAERLFLSVKTIESYRSRLMTKLNLRDRAALTQLAIEQGILGPGTQRL